MVIGRMGDDLGGILPRLRRLAFSLTDNHDDADDLVQLALERAIERAPDRDATRGLDGWLLVTMRNAWIDEVRSRQRGQQMFVHESLGEHVGDDAMGRQLAGLDIASAMRRLPDDHRIVVSLVLIEGLSYQEAARLLDIPLGTLTSRLARAREALQSMLQDDS